MLELLRVKLIFKRCTAKDSLSVQRTPPLGVLEVYLQMSRVARSGGQCPLQLAVTSGTNPDSVTIGVFGVGFLLTTKLHSQQLVIRIRIKPMGEGRRVFKVQNSVRHTIFRLQIRL